MVQYSRAPVAATPVPGCSLMTGADRCRCPDDAHYLDDEQLIARSCEMFGWLQLAAPQARAAGRHGLDGLLAHARGVRSSAVVGELLAMGIAIRIHDGRLEDAGAAELMLAELGERAERAGDGRLLADARTLRAHYSCVFTGVEFTPAAGSAVARRGAASGRHPAFGPGERPLVDAAEALAILTDLELPDGAADRTAWSRSSSSLILVLLTLGAHEIADEISQRAITMCGPTGSAMELLIHQVNRVRLQLSWALRLERIGRDAAAGCRLVGAAQAAQAASRLWRPALRRRAQWPAPAQECPIIGAAYALHRPGPQHLPTLAGVARIARHPDDRVAVAIATARCLLADGRPGAALAALDPLRAELGDHGTDAVLTSALHREFAGTEALARRTGHGPERRDPGTDALARYAAALEDELAAQHAAGVSALRSYCENHRLSRAHGALTREHGAVTAQLQLDPLTGLLNRRALDQRLAEATGESSQPCAVALIDLDRFKDVNDVRSHAVGDIVLRQIAAALRAALRSKDVLARYGGDEFVVIMPSTPLAEANAALTRATRAIAELPPEVASGVTMSVGVVGAPPDGEPAATLAAADAAMYRAKHEGGNKVISAAATEPHRIGAIRPAWSYRR
jgi:diguanylate cyclase (GGDEF)-like protein